MNRRSSPQSHRPATTTTVHHTCAHVFPFLRQTSLHRAGRTFGVCGQEDRLLAPTHPSLSLSFLTRVYDWSGANRTPDCRHMLQQELRMGRFAWDKAATHRVRWATLRARVCSDQCLQPKGRSSQRCLLYQKGPGAMDPGLRLWAQPERCTGNKQRVETSARATYGCSRPRTAQQLSLTIEQ